MLDGFAKLVIDVPDLNRAVQDYSVLFGEMHGTPTLPYIALGNIGIELRALPTADAAEISELWLWRDADSAGVSAAPADCRGLSVQVTRHREVAAAGKVSASGIQAVDHLVLQTTDADDCIRLFGDDGFGMRLALDQLVPQWGGRMLFFRCGKLTLEVIHNLEQPPLRDHFWGLTFQCPDLDATLAALDSAGVAHSEVRAGRKPGTRVATIKSHDLGIPTLLLEPALR